MEVKVAKDLGRQLHDNLADDGDVRGDGVRDDDQSCYDHDDEYRKDQLRLLVV